MPKCPETSVGVFLGRKNNFNADIAAENILV